MHRPHQCCKTTISYELHGRWRILGLSPHFLASLSHSVALVHPQKEEGKHRDDSVLLTTKIPITWSRQELTI